MAELYPFGSTQIAIHFVSCEAWRGPKKPTKKNFNPINLQCIIVILPQYLFFWMAKMLGKPTESVKKLSDINQVWQRIAMLCAFTRHWRGLLSVLLETKLCGISLHTFLFSLGVAFGDGARLGDGELNKSASSSSKSPEDFSLAGLLS